MKRRHIPRLSATQIIMLSFFSAILLGSLLLSLPISLRDGVSLSYVDALFTATSATCVTGLLTVPLASTFSTFGHIVILLLIQIGGLGVTTVAAAFLIALHKRLSLRDVHLLQEAFNLNTIGGLAAFVRRVVRGTLIVEGIGALLYLPVFLPEYGVRGIFYAIFTSISAFCNAGMDLFGSTSLTAYVLHPLVNAVTSLLVILGGLGYIVWWDVLRILPRFRKQGLRALSYLTLHSKIVLAATAGLLAIGTLGFLLFEYANPETLGNLPFLGKLGAAFFQSVTTRTAGFYTIPQESLTTASVFLSLLLMFVGGSPVGTAGGIKTVTLLVLLSTAYCTIRSRREIALFGRTFTREATSKAVAVTGMSFAIMAASTICLSLTGDIPLADVLYETVSATATVGLSRALTPLLTTVGRLIITATMYFGRIGPITLFIALKIRRDGENSIKNPTEEISVG